VSRSGPKGQDSIVTRIALVRHGQTDWNLQRRIQGSSDIPLNETGRAQARHTGAVLSGRQWDAVYASPLVRAMDTARLIAEASGLPEPEPLEGMQERRYGAAEGLTGEEILSRFPDGAPIPGQETRADVVERALPALEDLGRRHPDSAFIVVTHGGVIASLVRHVTDHALPAPGDVIANGSVHDFEFLNGRLALRRFNIFDEDHDLFLAAVS
jgi:probable phosphoglycerate mutase